MTLSPWDDDQLPLSRFELLRSADLEAVEAAAGRVYSPHRMMPRRAAALDAQLHSVHIGALGLSYFKCGAAVHIDSQAPLNYYAVNLPISGGARIRFASTEVTTAPTAAVVLSPVEQVAMSWSDDLSQLCVKIDAKSLQEHARRLTPLPLRPVRFEPRLAVTPSRGDPWIEVVRLVDQTIRLCPDGNVPSLLTRQIEQMVMTTLLLRQPNSCSEQLLQSVPSASLSAVRRAAEIMEDRPDQQFTITDLASDVGVSVRALQEGFRRQFGVTPTEYLLGVRLVRARELIERGVPAPSRVSEVAYRVGFVHLGRFAQLYRQRFGVSPSVALRARRSCA